MLFSFGKVKSLGHRPLGTGIRTGQDTAPDSTDWLKEAMDGRERNQQRRAVGG